MDSPIRSIPQSPHFPIPSRTATRPASAKPADASSTTTASTTAPSDLLQRSCLAGLDTTRLAYF